MQIKLTKEQREKVIISSADAYYIIRSVLMRENKMGRAKEHFWTMSLSNASKILLLELVSLGTQTHTAANPIEVFAFPLQKRASRLILIHNHPSGFLEPSEQDRIITERLIAAGDLLNLPVIDHLVISETGFFSFDDKGLIVKLRAGESFLSKKERRAIKDYAEQYGKEKGIKIGREEERIAIAKNLINQKLPLDLIVEATGLSKRRLKNL